MIAISSISAASGRITVTHPASPRDANAEAFYHHIRVSHTPVEEIGPIAQSAGVKKLALYHLTSSDMTQQDGMDEVSGFDGRVVVGFPLTGDSID